MKKMENKEKIINAKIGIGIAVVIQIILCLQHEIIFWIFAGAMLCYIGYGLFKVRHSKIYWIQMQRILTVILVIEFLAGFPLIYLFQKII